jgi:hypothetical protein
VVIPSHKKGTSPLSPTTGVAPATGRIRPTNSIAITKAGKASYVYGTPFLHYSDVIYISVP